MNEKSETEIVLVKDRMIKTFTTLPETLSPAEAGSRLQPGTFGVVLDKYGQPIALVTAGDVKKAADSGAPRLDHPSAGLPPAIITDSEVKIQTLIRSDVMTLFDIGARCAVVMENNEVTGVLQADAITDYIGRGEISPVRAKKGYAAVVDAGLGGSHQVPLGRIRCFECGFVNTVSFIDENNLPPCKNPNLSSHTLALH